MRGIMERSREKISAGAFDEPAKGLTHERADAAAEIKRLRAALAIATSFIDDITDATGPYPELNGTPIVGRAYRTLADMRAAQKGNKVGVSK